MSKQYRILAISAIILFFSVFGYWKFEDVLTTPEMCLTNYGDGIGGIGDIFTLKQEVDDKGIGILLGDTRSFEKVGFGLSAPSPQSLYWNWNLWGLSQIFSPDNVYDVNALIAFILIGLFSFILLREMGVSILFSLVGSLLMIHLDHFFIRLNSHLLGLGTYYFPLLLCWGAVLAGKKPTLVRLLILAFLNVLNFLVNEYYGYFGLFFSYGLFLGYFLKNIKNNSLPMSKICVWFILSGIVFIAMMGLAYPNLVLERIISLFYGRFGSEVGIHNAGHPWSEFLFYSVRKPLSFFSPSVPFIKKLVAGEVFKSDLGEFTFRIGLVVPMSILVCMFVFGYDSVFRKSKKSTAALWQCAIWICVATVIFFFAISPKKCISLVPITFKIAPMFRVGARAFLYIDIVAVVLFVYTIDVLSRIVLKKTYWENYIVLRGLNGSLFLLLLMLALLGILDVTGDRIWHKVPSTQLPDTSIYESLRGKTEGLLLELPMCSPITHPPECNYLCMYNRTKHGFPIVNTAYPLPTNVEFREALHRLSEYVNTLSPQVVTDLKSAGVRYIVVDKTKSDDSNLRKSMHLKLVAERGNKSIFMMKDDGAFGKDDFLEYFVYSEPTFSFQGDFHQPERNDKTYWIWCGREGEIILKNHSKYDKQVIFRATFVLKAGSTLVIESRPHFYDALRVENPTTGSHPEAVYQKMLHIKAKNSLKLSITSDAAPYSAKDPNLVFCMYEYRAKSVD